MIEISAPDLATLEADLGRAVMRAPDRARAAVEVSARNVRDWSRRAISGLAHAPLYPRSITYDIGWTRDGVEAEIGPDKDLPQGALGNLLEFGSVHNPAHAHLGPQLLRVTPDFERGVALAAGDL